MEFSQKPIKKINYNKTIEKIFSKFEAFVCIPITRKKKPVISWKNLIKTPKNKFDPEHNIALITGQINGLTVIDIDRIKSGSDDADGMAIYQELLDKYNNGKELDIPICLTQSNGLHLYFAYDPEIQTTTKINGYSIDIRNDGALIIAPPSVGESGPYIWKNNKSLHNSKLTAIPQWFKDWLKTETKVKVVKSKTIEVKSIIKQSKYLYIYDLNDLIELLNSLPSKYLDNYMDWIIITGCLKSENLKEIWDKWSAKSTSYDYENNNRIWDELVSVTDLCYLNVIAKSNSNIYVIKKTIKSEFLTKPANCLINEKYLDSKHLNDDKAQIIKSDCGTGKTTLSSQHINNLLKTNNKLKVLSISVRVSLACQQIKTFAANKIIMSLYKDLSNDQINKTNKLVIQIDSIFRIDLNLWKNAIIYLDEVSALFSYILTSDTLKDKRYLIFINLYKLLKNADMIICTDADVNDMVLSLFDQIDIKYYLICNTYKTIKETLATEYQSKEILIRLIENNLSNSENVICCFDSKREMESIVQRLKLYCETNKLIKQLEKFLIYSSTEGDENDFLSINEKWKNKNIFYTPKITIGVSFDNKTSRKVYLFAQNNSLNSIGFVQQISRCRNISELHYYVANSYQQLKYNLPNDVESHYINLADEFETTVKSTLNTDDDNFNFWMTDDMKLKELFDNHCLIMNYKTGKWMFTDDVFNKLFFMYEYYDNVLRSAPREQFRWMLEEKGYVIQYNKETSEAKVICRKNILDKIIYSNPKSLTDPEKIIYNNAIKYAKFLNIDFNSKVSKKKYQNILISDKMFIKHYAFMMLFDKTNTTKEQMKDDYKIDIPNNLYIKIGLIKQLEKILNIETLCIDTKIDIQRFSEEIIISDSLRKQINKVFRVSKKIDGNEIGKFKYWYYQLINMYKNMLGNDMFEYAELMKKYTHYNSYSINNESYNLHNLLL